MGQGRELREEEAVQEEGDQFEGFQSGDVFDTVGGAENCAESREEKWREVQAV